MCANSSSLFDTELFDRTQRAARLTEKGEEMFVLAKKLLQQRDAAVEQFGKPGEVLERRIRIGVTELTAMTWLPRLGRADQGALPEGHLSSPMSTTAVQRAGKLLADELDLVIVPDTLAESRVPGAKPSARWRVRGCASRGSSKSFEGRSDCTNWRATAC